MYAALSGPHSRFAQRSDRALRYAPDVAPFLALPGDASKADWRDAAELVAPEGLGFRARATNAISVQRRAS